MSELVPDAAVKAIQESVQTQQISVADDEFVTRPVFAPPVEKTVETLGVHTLTGLVDYLSSGVDADVVVDGACIHVVNPELVELVGPLRGRPKQRDTLLSAEFATLGFRFGQWYSCEDFNINLQSLFVDDEERGKVLKIVGNLKEEAVAEWNDDGVSQAVVARAGIARVERVQVPNPVTLRPYRTFPEVSQPASAFILRLKRSTRDGEMPNCALFEADGGKWRLEAIEGIARYLRVKIGELSEPLNKLGIIA